jgi:hypothetical protein
VIPPPGIPNWPSVVWLEKKGQKWQSHGIDGDPDLPEKLKQHVGAGHTGATADLAHFYTLHWAIMDDPEMPAPDLDAFEGESVRMAALFSEGELIE